MYILIPWSWSGRLRLKNASTLANWSMLSEERRGGGWKRVSNISFCVSDTFGGEAILRREEDELDELGLGIPRPKDTNNGEKESSAEKFGWSIFLRQEEEGIIFDSVNFGGAQFRL